MKDIIEEMREYLRSMDVLIPTGYVRNLAEVADWADRIESMQPAAGPWRTDVENAEHGKQYIVILDGFFGGEPRALWCDSESASDPCWREYREGPVVAWQDSTVAFAELNP